ncbi:MAG: PfaD family polyunsaturated fatty acid/polyketide biosynthesis protein [Pseudomonadota bacterium]|nr:PfaD family polyunsaturated fatty acid/polyketide biosynthesis protein [Pseudomonadota bacterium]
MNLMSSARSVRIVRGDKAEELSPGGTGLARAVDQAGASALAALLADGADGIELEDADVTVRVERDGDSARVSTSWATGERHVQDVPLPGRGRPVADLAAALHDPGRTLRWHEGRWWEGEGPAELVVPAMRPDRLGAPSFREAHGVRYNYVAGAMAGGIASPELVTAMSHAGYLGYFGAGGLPVEAVRDGVRAIKAAVGDRPAGFNLLHNPAEPAVEEATVDLFLEHGCTEVDASAFMGLTAAVVRYRLHGIHEVDGKIVTPNRVSAKVSRPEVAEPFLRPAPAKLLEGLVAAGKLTPRQAELARKVPVAEDITAEADSGGHTDRRPLPVLIPLFRRLASRIAAEEGYAVRPRIGAAGGIGDPSSLAAAMTLGADYVMTGSINQATPEAGTSDAVREMLAQAGYADVTMGPAPDMFEMGAQVQVLSRGTMYAQRAARLYELYRGYGGLDEIPPADRERLEKQIFQRPIAEVWAETEAFWAARDPRELQRAREDRRHQMALCFRWYLGLSSRWARVGDASRKRDYQVWCGPAMGLFNDWVRGSWLEPLGARSVVTIADTLMRGACVALRLQIAAAGPALLPEAAWRVVPWRANGNA